MSNSADVLLQQAPPDSTKKATAVFYMGEPGSRNPKYDLGNQNKRVSNSAQRQQGSNGDSTGTNNQSRPEDGQEPEQEGGDQAAPTSVPANTIPMPATEPENNNSEAGSLSSSTTSTAVDALKMNETATTSSSMTIGANNNSEAAGDALQINETTTGQGSSTTTHDASEVKETATSLPATSAQSNNSPSSTTTTADDLKINCKPPATTSSASQTTVLIVTPIDKNPALENAVSDDSTNNKAQLPTPNDDGNPTESKSEKKISTSSTDSHSIPNLRSPDHQKMVVDSTPNISQQGEKLNKCCCCIYW